MHVFIFLSGYRSNVRIRPYLGLNELRQLRVIKTSLEITCVVSSIYKLPTWLTIERHC